MKLYIIAILILLLSGCFHIDNRKETVSKIEKIESIEEKPTIVIFPIENATGVMEYDVLISDGTKEVINVIAGTKKISVIDISEVKKYAQKYDLEEADKIGNMMNANLVVFARVSKVTYQEKRNDGGHGIERIQEIGVVVEARIHNIKTGKNISGIWVDKKYRNRFMKTNEKEEGKSLELDEMFSKVFSEAISEIAVKIEKKII